MSTCSIKNIETKEPSVKFKTDRGNLYNTYYDALNNSDRSFDIGFDSESGEFVKVGSQNILDTSTREGRIQKYIKNGYLKDTQIAPNKFEAVDGLSADILQSELILTDMNGYKREGDIFEFGDFSPKVEKGNPFNIVYESIQTYVKELTKSEPKATRYTEDQLKSLILDFMSRMGYSTMSIENYNKAYKSKYGVEPDANAFIDFNNKIIAFSDGNITLDELSEEFSHFMVEAWNQEEIDRILPYVVNTREYSEYAEQYRQIYSKSIKDSVELEKAVRKEVLGKLLAKSLSKDFNIENRSENEVNIFNKLLDLFKKFINFLRGKIDNNVRKEIDDLANEIKKVLYNKNLANKLNTQFQPTVDVMYRVNNNQLTDYYNRVGKENLRNELLDLIESYEEGVGELRKKLLDNSSNLENSDRYEIELMIESNDLFEKIESKYKRYLLNKGESDLEFSERLKNLRQGIFDLKTLYSNQQYLDKEVVAEALINKYADHLSEEQRKAILEDVDIGVNAVQRDSNFFVKWMMPTDKQSNLFVNLLSNIIDRMQGLIIMKFGEDANRLLKPLEKVRHLLHKFRNGIYIKSNVDVSKLDKDRRKYEYEILKNLDPNNNIGTFEDYEIYYNKEGAPIKRSNPLYYKFQYEFWKNIGDKKFANNQQISMSNKIFSIIEQMGLENRNESVEDSFVFRYIIDKMNNENNEVSFDYDVDTLSSIAMTYEEAKEKVAKGEIDPADVISMKSNLTLFGQGKFLPKNRELVYYIKDGSKGLNSEKFSNDKTLQDFYDYYAYKKIEHSLFDSEEVKKGFAKQVKEQLKKLDEKGIKDPVEREKQFREWLGKSISFNPSEQYWENFNSSEIDFDKYYKQGDTNRKAEMEALEIKLKVLQVHRNSLLKRFKNKDDFKEIDVTKILDYDKKRIFAIDHEIRKVKEEILLLFQQSEIDFYTRGYDFSKNLNQAFYKIFEADMGVSFDKASIDQIRTFFFKEFSEYDRNRVITFERLLRNKNNLSSVEKYVKSAERRGYDPTNKDDVLKTFLIENAPVWYRRVDANDKYDKFLRLYQSGKISAIDLASEYANGNTDVISYKDDNGNKVIVPNFIITPSMKYMFPSRPDVKSLLAEYQSLDNSSMSNMNMKFKLLVEAADFEDVQSKEYVDKDMANILTNKELLEAYMTYMDAHVQRLLLDDNAKSHYIFLQPQQRKTAIDRFKSGVTKGGIINQIKNYYQESIHFKPDELERSFETSTIPKYGYYKLTESDITDDMYMGMTMALYNAHQRKQRADHLHDAFLAQRGLSDQQFDEGKLATDTNYYKTQKEMIDYSFFGKRVSTQWKTKIAGKEYDFTKLAFGFKNLAIGASLGLSPIVALTNFTSGLVQSAIINLTNRDMYKGVNGRVISELSKLGLNSTTISDIGSLRAEGKMGKLLEQFGFRDITKSAIDSNFNRVIRMLPDTIFSMMSMTNYPLETGVLLSKLMEYRLIDGRFISWRQFLIEQKTKNPSKSDSELQAEFDKYSNKSMYDYLDDDGVVMKDKLQKDGLKADIDVEKARVYTDAMSLRESITMEITKHHEGEGGRDPRLSFFTSLKKWMVLAASAIFSNKRYNLKTGAEEQGMAFAIFDIIDMIKAYNKDKTSFIESYRKLSEGKQKSLRQLGYTTSAMLALYVLSTLLLAAADDDDEEDNYFLQLAAYLSVRTLNETFSGSVIGFPNSMFETLQQPIMSTSYLTNMIGVLDFRKIGEEIDRGPDKGTDKWVRDFLKVTWMKNLWNVRSGDVIRQKRESFQNHNLKNSLYHVFSLLIDTNEEEEENDNNK